MNNSSLDDGTPPDFAWVSVNADPADTAAGWEASATVPTGNYPAIGQNKGLNVHTQIYNATDPVGETAAVPGRAISLTLECGTTAVTLADFKSGSAEMDPAIALGVLSVLGLALVAWRLW